MILKLISFAVISVAIYVVIALGLIVSQRPSELPSQDGLDFTNLMAKPFTPPQDPAFQRQQVTLPDGTLQPVTTVKTADALPLLVMVHGSGWHGGQFDQLAWSLRDVAETRAVTLRGHGEAPARRGDVDYIGQLEDDIAAVIGDTDRPVVLLGHSSGGGLVIRFSGGKHRNLIDGAVLLAPFLKYNAPTMRDNSGGWTVALTRRLAGLSMLNMVGVTALNHLTVIQFNMPRAVLNGPHGHMATLAYSYRLNTSYAPRNDYLRDVAAVPPFLLVAGKDDEAFKAEAYQDVLSGANPNGRYVLIDGVGHLDVVNAPETEQAIRDMLREL